METALKEQGFNQSKADSCLFTKSEKGKTIHLILYVDDILIAAENLSQINKTVNALKQSFEITNLGEVRYYLGIEVSKNSNGDYFLSQKNKIEEVVKKFGLENGKPTYTPMETGYYQLQGEEDLLENNQMFRQAIGSLLFISNITRPDITAAVHILSRRCEKPRQRDWNSVKRIIRYLKTTKELKLEISSKENPVLQVYSDADFAQDKSDRKSTSGQLIFLGKSCISWKSKKQNCVHSHQQKLNIYRWLNRQENCCGY